MIIDCEAALVLTRCADRPRYSRAKVGIASDNGGNPVLVVITSNIKEKFKIVNNCSLRPTTISFDAPKKDLYIRNCDNMILKAFMSLMTKILKKQLIPKLAKVSVVEKLKPKPTALTIRDNDFSASDLSNKCLQRLVCDNFRLIPRLVWKLNNLVDLKINNCELTEIPMKLNDLGPNLRLLDLSNNEIHSFDGSFVVGMRRLKSLDLNHNKLEFIPFEIKLMSSLERLNLSYNQLSDLPNTLGKISSMQSLDLSHNNLNCLPFTFIKNLLRMTRLNGLDISGNPLREQKSSPSSEIDKSFPSLVTLSSAAILSNDDLLYSCHKYLPQSLYINIVKNGENCAICGRIVADKQIRRTIVQTSLERIANCLSTSPFPTFPMVPASQIVCRLCI